MDNLRQKLEEIDSYLASIEVKGDNVISLAIARQKLKEFYNLYQENNK